MPKHDHTAKLAEVRKIMPDDNTLFDLGDFFKILGDTTRIKILWSLFEADLCVCAIAELLGMEQSAISHQLRILKKANLVKSERDGKTNVYSLADDHVRDIIGEGYDHLRGENCK